MIGLLSLLVTIALLKVLVNGWRYIQCQRYLEKYNQWLKEPNWQLDEIKPRVIELLKSAGVEDSDRPYIEPVGYMHLATGTLSVFANFTTRREDITCLIVRMFHEAIGIYRSRTLEAFSPLYWIDLAVNLPKHVLGYLGIPPEKMVTKVGQVAWWVMSTVLALVYTSYKAEIDKLVRGWINRLTP